MLCRRWAINQIEVDDGTYDKLVFAARVSGLTIAQVVSRLTTPLAEAADAPGTPPATSAVGSEVGVYVVYRGSRVDGTLDLATERLRITQGPSVLVGREFRSPTQAAMETVKALNPERERPETNGWRFWKDVSTGRIIDRLRSPDNG